MYYDKFKSGLKVSIEYGGGNIKPNLCGDIEH